MKYTIFDNNSVIDVRKRINKHIAITTVIVALAVALNIVLCIVRSESTHVAFLVINIVADICAFSFAVFFADIVIAPEKRIYKLYVRLDYGEKLSCTVENVSTDFTRVSGIPCRAVESEDGRRFFIAENATTQIKRGYAGTFTLVDNIAVEVTVNKLGIIPRDKPRTRVLRARSAASCGVLHQICPRRIFAIASKQKCSSNKREIKNHFQYKWWIYVLLAVAVVALWLTVFGVLKRVDDTEKLHITFIGAGFDGDKLKSDLQGVIKSDSKQEIKQINVESIIEQSDYTLTMLVSTRAQGTTDLFIWSGELKGNIADMFARLDEDAVTDHFGTSVVCLRDGEGIYGIELTQNETFSKYYSGSEKCYLFVSASSVNFGGINGKGEPDNDAGIAVIKYLLGVA